MNENLGDLIRSSRNKKAITLRAMARELGISAALLSSIETGATMPESALICMIAAKLDLDPHRLCGLAETITPETEKKLSKVARTDPIFFRKMIERIGGAT